MTMTTDPNDFLLSSGVPSFKFDKIGDTYFLSQIWLKGYRSGNQITESKRQQELESRGLTTEKRSVAGEVGRATR